MGRLLLIEGIPGSGKTTLSKKAAEYLSERVTTEYYNEGDGHPADLAWCACIPLYEYETIVRNYPEYKEQMNQHSIRDENHYIVPYLQFPIHNQEFFQLMESYEVYDNRRGYHDFKDMHVARWRKFGISKKHVDKTFVFECSFLQNHVNELLLFHCMTQEQIQKYLLELIHTVMDLNPVLLYLNSVNVSETIQRVSEVRVNEKNEKEWMERVIEYIENSPLGKKYKLCGFEGMVTYFEERKKIELAVVDKLPIATYVIHNQDYNWEGIWSEIKVILDVLD